ncbi:MAG: hypothetical protein IMZ71_02810 [Chloroflexi bacterium]|nr:hypothetical protein [Chloroflexota bacterium]
MPTAQEMIDKIDTRLEAIVDRTDQAAKVVELMKMREMYQALLDGVPYDDVATIDLAIDEFGQDLSTKIGDDA